MFGAEVPDLSDTPCPACERTVDAGDVVWDPYQREDRRLAALPYHRACAGELLPPPEPDEAMFTCPICKEDFEAEVLTAAFTALHARFTRPKAAVATPEIVWRLAARDPARVYLAEHFACILGLAEGKAPGQPQP